MDELIKVYNPVNAGIRTLLQENVPKAPRDTSAAYDLPQADQERAKADR